MTTAIGTYATRAAVSARLENSASLSAADLDLIDDLCDQFNAWLESETKRPICPRTETTVYLDGYMAEDGGRALPIPFGVNAVSTLAIAVKTNTNDATWHTITSDVLLRPLAMLRRPGWPATLLRITDVPSSGYAIFWPGYNNVRITGSLDGSLMPFGWPAIPDELIRLANDAVVRTFSARQRGESDIIGTGENGQPIVSWRISARDQRILDTYSLKPRAAGGGQLVTAWGG